MVAYDLAFHVLHCFLSSIGLVFNVILFVAIVRQTPSNFVSYSFILANSAVVDLLSNIGDMLVIQRIIPSSPILAYLFYGPCGSARFCYLIYIVMVHFLIHSLLLLCVAFWYRYAVLVKSPAPSRRRLAVIIFAVYLPSFFQMFSLSFGQGREEVLSSHILNIYPQIDLGSFILTGHESMTDLLTAASIAYVACTPTPAYAFILFMRFKASPSLFTLSRLQESPYNVVMSRLSALSAQMSSKTKKTHKQLITALTFHALLPTGYILAVAFFSVMFFGIYHHPLLEYAVFVITSIPPTINPLLTLYFVGPYRRLVASSLGITDKSSVSAVGPPSTSRRIVSNVTEF